MKNYWRSIVYSGLFAVMVITGCSRQKPAGSIDPEENRRTGGNPVIDEGSADPSVRVFGNRVYIYPSHDYSPDNEFWIMKDWKVYSSRDLVNFTDHGAVLEGRDLSWAVEPDHCWAPDCIEKSGRYYFYFPLSDKRGIWKGKIGVAVADNPWGPFRDALDRPLVDDDDAPPGYTGGFYNIDPAVFTDEDGRSYLFWGNGACFMAELGEDMTSFASGIQNVVIEDHRGYREGPFVWKREGVYYLLYSRSGSSANDVLDYAAALQVQGPYRFRGTIIGHGMKGNEHGSVFCFRDQWYVAYHDLFPTDKYRKTCLDIIHYRNNGEIARRYPSRKGVGWYDAAERIEAEDYFEKSQGLEYREYDSSCFHISRVTDGTWLKFPNVTLPFDCKGSFSARFASGSSGGIIEVLADSLGGILIGELRVGYTGGWNDWLIMEAETVSLSGTTDIFLRFRGGEGELLNLDWFSFQ